jgi:hypothetical protein
MQRRFHLYRQSTYGFFSYPRPDFLGSNIKNLFGSTGFSGDIDCAGFNDVFSTEFLASR